KVEFLSVPYKAIIRFAVETAGSFDADAEVKLWISGREEPKVLEFKKGIDIIGVQKILAEGVLS
ncbi:MAG: PH domain-containing protein, partial [Magnetococcales bacterium]|nr:PH domain-containing protein [Magnetococcales bacterium]